MRTRLIALLVPMLVLAMGVIGTAAAAPGGGERVDVIVVLHDGEDARDAARDAARNHNADVSFIYEHALQGFAGSVPEGRLHALERDPRVDYVELDRPVSIQAETVPTGVQRIFADANTNIGINDGVDDAVDVDVAVLDTGIDFEHPDLNVVGGADCTASSGGGPPWARTYYCDDTDPTAGDDDHYHGTHVAGTIGAIDNDDGVVGVAPGARLWAVKVLDSSGSGYTSGIVAGIEWVVANGDIEVLNMSLGGSGRCDGTAYDDAITNAVTSGVAVAVAAGNSSADANNYSPASCDRAFTVSALADGDGAPGGETDPTCRDDQDDTFADFSNWGSAVDVIAPGVCILSTYPIEQGSYGTISGTSMAAPHAAGALALLASSNNPSNGTDVQALYDQLISSGNYEWDSSDDGDNAQEPLLDVSDTDVFNPVMVSGGGGGGETNSPPTASFTYSCTDLACDFDGSGSSDSDGSISFYAWDFGDSNTGSGATVSHTFAGDGTYTVKLTVTDDDGATNSSSQSVTVSSSSDDGGGTDVTLDVTAYKVRGTQYADLSWSGLASTNVDIRRNGVVIATTTNHGEHTDTTGDKGGGSADYQVCEVGTATCTGVVTADW